MHEYSIVQALLDRVAAEARSHGAVAVHRIRVQIGEASGVESDLSVGQIVVVKGEIDSNGTTGTANEVIFDDSVKGPVQSINLAGSSLVVLGQTVLVTADTSFDDNISPASLDGLTVGDIVEVSGLPDANGKTVTLSSLLKQGPVVLVFYRGGWCPYCNLHLAEMASAEEELLEMGFDVWFISIDQPSVLAEGQKYGDVSYTLLSDSLLEATRAFGIAFTLDEDTRLRYLRNDIDIEAASGQSHHVLPVPSTFIIGKDGIVSFQYTNVDYQVRLAPELLVAAAGAHAKNYDQRLRIHRAEQRAAEKQSGN